MPQLVEHLAELTGFRDRDVLDVTLVGALRDLLQPQTVAVYRLVEDGAGQRWITRARLSQTELVAVADSAWTELDRLPRLDEHPRRRDCLRHQQVLVESRGETVRTCFPLDTDREVVGVLEIDSTGPLGDEQRRLVTAILRIYRNFQGLLDYSERDTLTGLLNRKTFDETFLKTATAGVAPSADALHPAPERRRDAAPGWWLAVVDIDHFKRVNDNHGHLIGDEVLLLLSRLMRSCFRFHDRLYRFGGEEFVVLLRCHGEDEAAQALERLRGRHRGLSLPAGRPHHGQRRFHPGAPWRHPVGGLRAGRQGGVLGQGPRPQPGLQPPPPGECRCRRGRRRQDGRRRAVLSCSRRP
ncbi:sensor domain-containing diguanylate cyclase [Aquabacterium sp. J223]|uniref:GGDEF domain-containing protein n=1 Tax=Aquabacterium sp. J223 TaxID=2898431 RepID=UPI0021AE2E36|nr:GGDEF domain-containing protein [Aquabacterium sp. J223]UUX95702.1 GGDEF domain-containing protein [Aquabacterium sp. J223]